MGSRGRRRRRRRRLMISKKAAAADKHIGKGSKPRRAYIGKRGRAQIAGTGN
jgi:hypothetical protein